MFRLLLLSSCFLTAIVAQATIKKNSTESYTIRILSPDFFLPAGDTLPAIKKSNLLKKLAAAIQFRKKAQAKEQLRVMAIIDNSGLKKSLDSINNKIVSLDNLATGKDSSLAELQTAVKELRAAIHANRKTAGNVTTDSSIADPATLIDSPLKDKEIENLVKEVMPLLNDRAADEQQEKEKREKLRLLRNVMFRPPNQVDTIALNDTIKKTFTIQLRNKAFVTGFYHHNNSRNYSSADGRLINTLAWYAITFNGQTGNVTGLNGYDTALVITKAQQQGCAITLTVINNKRTDISAFLSNIQAQKKLTENIITLLALRQANGVNIYFENLPPASGSRFVQFIRYLSDTLQAIRSDYTVNIVLPPADPDNAWHPEALTNFVDHFFIDFTQQKNNIPGPLAPLQGTHNNDLTACLSRYLNKNIPPEKFIVYLPYYGAIYKINRNGQFNTFFNYISYSEIRSTYQLPAQFDKATSTAYIDITATKKGRSGAVEETDEVIGRIWFDDDKTLSLKYDFILQNGLGGVAFQALGYDGEYGELRDALANKFILADTLYLAEINMRPAAVKPAPLDGWQWTWPYITAKYEQYYFLFAYPCETTYPRILVRRWQKAGVVNNDRNSIKNEGAFLFGMISLLLLIMCLAFSFLFIYQVRRLAKWRWKKWCAGILIFLCILLTSSTCMYLFLNNQIAGFGTSESSADCFDFPLNTLALFIFTGLLIGMVITRFLVFPLMKKEDVP
jgi:spore germination protein YaaH